LFRKYGYLTQCGIHWDRLGNSKGSASIEFDRVAACKAAIRDLNNQTIAGLTLMVRFVRKNNVVFRKNGLRLGQRRNNNKNFNNSNNRNN